MFLNLTLFLTKFADGSAAAPYLFFGALIVVGIAIWMIKKTLSRKRTEGMKTASQEIGFTFEGDQWTDLNRAPMMETALFGKGRNGATKNITTGSRDGLRVSVFDYSMMVGRGKGAHTETQTVGAFSKSGVYLPYFELRWSRAFDKVWDAVAHENIHFDSSPEFAGHFVLRSPSETEVRSLFTPGLLSFFEQMNVEAKWTVEGAGNTLIIYHRQMRIAPAQLREFLDKTSSVASSFFSLGNCPVDKSK